MDETKIAVDVVIETTDTNAVADIESELQPLEPVLSPATREPVTILAVSAGVVQLIKALVDLWQSKKRKATSPAIRIEVASGATLQLDVVKSAQEIEVFIRGASG